MKLKYQKIANLEGAVKKARKTYAKTRNPSHEHILEAENWVNAHASGADAEVQALVARGALVTPANSSRIYIRVG